MLPAQSQYRRSGLGVLQVGHDLAGRKPHFSLQNLLVALRENSIFTDYFFVEGYPFLAAAGSQRVAYE
jgi:hypothetical protein